MIYPRIIINFKTYASGIGHNALRMAQWCQQAASQDNILLAVAVDATDIRLISDHVTIPVLGQHVDGVGYGAHTGRILAASIKDAGAWGTLLNHSEDPYTDEALKAAITSCKELGLLTIVCAPNSTAAGRYATFHPDMIAIEPPELIGSGISVSQAQPSVITDTIQAVTMVNPSIPVLCGAGISTSVDVQKARQLGAHGVLLASGVIEAPEPLTVLHNLITGFK